MLGASIEPMAAHSASATPVTPANSMLVSTTTYARPPRKWPTRLLANSISLGKTPHRCMRSPAMMKNGMASNGNESMPPNMSVGRTAIGIVPDSTMNVRPPSPRQNAMGTPSVIVKAKTAMRRAISTRSGLRARRSRRDAPPEAEQPRHDHQGHEQRADGKRQVEPEDGHAERQRVLIELGRQHLEPGHGQHEKKHQREQ